MRVCSHMSSFHCADTSPTLTSGLVPAPRVNGNIPAAFFLFSFFPFSWGKHAKSILIQLSRNMLALWQVWKMSRPLFFLLKQTPIRNTKTRAVLFAPRLSFVAFPLISFPLLPNNPRIEKNNRLGISRIIKCFSFSSSRSLFYCYYYYFF